MKGQTMTAANSGPVRHLDQWALERFQPYAGNSRTHSDEQVEQVAASIKEFGFTNPILAKSDGTIAAGHARLAAARLLNLPSAPVIVIDDWTDEQFRAYVLADNQLALLADWDEKILADELRALAAENYDLGVIGFSDEELAALMASAMLEGLTDPDAVPEAPINPVTVQGDTWLLGKHRLRCGDSTSATDVEGLLAGVKPHLMVTDPPYGVNYDPKWRFEAGVSKNTLKMGAVLNDDKADWREAWALFPGDVAYVWHAGLFAGVVAESLEACEFKLRSQIIWSKDRFALSRGDYHWQHEPCWYAVREKATGHWASDRKQATVWAIKAREDGGFGHGTQKPVQCMKRPIENNSSPGQAVYEPFSGSGTTIIAAEMTGRIAYAMELSPVYVDVAVKRWQEFTGLKAVLDGDESTFEDMAAHRYDWKEDAVGSYDEAIAEKRFQLGDAQVE